MQDETGQNFPSAVRASANSIWGSMVMEVFARLGMEHVIVSPGSRSTPLVVAAARNAKLDATPVLDERTAGFFALGMAKRTRRPVALVCTSGTSGANYYPAVIEASMSGTPLLILTADRPPELRDCSAGQAIDQLKLYGDHVRRYVEVALPEATEAMLDYLRQTLVHAFDLACRPDPGPVHLNFPFREPLLPDAETAPVIGAELVEARASVVGRFEKPGFTGATFSEEVLERMAGITKGLIVVGAVNPPDDEFFVDGVALLSRRLGWPVLADVLNPLRGHSGANGALVCRYGSILGDDEKSAVLAPDAVLQIGPLPTSKTLRKWLQGIEVETFLLPVRPANTDPLHRRSIILHGEPHTLAEAIAHGDVDASWLATWKNAEEEEARRLESALAAMDEPFEGKAAWLLSQNLPVGTPVFIASSMPVRYAELFWVPEGRACPVYCNRGANGIDGTLGTAMGLAHGAPAAVLLTGDLAFLHDSNALLALSRLRGSLTVVLVNNGGGGIFEYLPAVREADVFEEFFATPQEVDIEALVRAHGASYERIENWDTFKGRVSSLPDSGVRVLELRTDRKKDRATMARLMDKR